MPEEMSTFDPEIFLAKETDAQFETKYTLVPEDDYTALIEKVVGRQTQTGQIVVDVIWNLMDIDELKEKLNLRQAFVKQGIFLDYENGILAEGENANINLGKLREAVNQNKKGKPWSFNQLIGAGPATVHVVQDGDYNKVIRVSRPQ